jgi:hypothetical protein
MQMIITCIFVFELAFGLAHGWRRWIYGAVVVAAFAALACAKTDGGCRWRALTPHATAPCDGDARWRLRAAAL